MDSTATLRDWTLEIRAKHGALTPEIVRDEARSPDSPAHAHVFNIPPGEAAEAYYLGRAHTLIQRVTIMHQPTPDTPPRRVRFYHGVPSDEHTYDYLPIDVILAQPAKFDQVRTAALRRLREAEESVADLDALASGLTRTGDIKKAMRAVRRARDLVASS